MAHPSSQQAEQKQRGKTNHGDLTHDRIENLPHPLRYHPDMGAVMQPPFAKGTTQRCAWSRSDADCGNIWDGNPMVIRSNHLFPFHRFGPKDCRYNTLEESLGTLHLPRDESSHTRVRNGPAQRSHLYHRQQEDEIGPR